MHCTFIAVTWRVGNTALSYRYKRRSLEKDIANYFDCTIQCNNKINVFCFFPYRNYSLSIDKSTPKVVGSPKSTSSKHLN